MLLKPLWCSFNALLIIQFDNCFNLAHGQILCLLLCIFFKALFLKLIYNHVNEFSVCSCDFLSCIVFALSLQDFIRSCFLFKLFSSLAFPECNLQDSLCSFDLLHSDTFFFNLINCLSKQTCNSTHSGAVLYSLLYEL